MAGRGWLLLDEENQAYIESLDVSESDVKGAGGAFRVRKRRLSGGRRDGVDVVELDNGAMSCVVLPTRGMGLHRIRAGDLELGWQSPVRGPVHPRHVRLFEPSGLGWLDGFDELLCRCGLESNGAPVFDDSGRLTYPLHGRIANTPAHRLELRVDGDAGTIELTGEVDEARLFHNKLRLTSTMRLKLGERRVAIEDRVTNLSAEAGELQLVYHTNFGRPLLEEGARVVLPAQTVVPCTAWAAECIEGWDVYGPPQPGIAEQVYFAELAKGADGWTETLLRNRAGSRGVSLRFDARCLPTFTLWKNTQDACDGYVTGLEPGVNLPNARPFEEAQGRVVKLDPGESRSFSLEIVAHGSESEVSDAEGRIAALRGDAEVIVHRSPQPTWSPG